MYEVTLLDEEDDFEKEALVDSAEELLEVIQKWTAEYIDKYPGHALKITKEG
jgi:hypothetical protein